MEWKGPLWSGGSSSLPFAVAVDLLPIAHDVPRKASRLVHIDGARGYLLSMMYLAHSAFALWGTSVGKPLLYSHHGNYLPVWDAEFFIPLSGFVCALSYRGVYERGGAFAAEVSILKRLRWVYLYQIVVAVLMVLFAAAVAPLLVNHYRPDPTMSLVQQLFGTLTFVVQPPNLDILMLYILLMSAMPFGFYLLRGGRTPLFAVVLVGLWLIAESGLDKPAGEFVIRNSFEWTKYVRLSGHFNPLSFAILFYAGFFLGDRYKAKGRDFVTTYLPPRTGLFISACAVLVGFLLYRAVFHSTNSPGRELLEMRGFAVVAATVYIVYYLLNRDDLPSPLRFAARLIDALFTFRPLVLLGQNSLFVYSLHVIIVSLVAFVALNTSLGRFPALVTMLFVIGYLTIFGAVSLKRRYLPDLP